jgi:hypothetical protein
VRYDLLADSAVPIDPPPEPAVVLSPLNFGDDWSEDLDGEGLEIAARYFRSIQHLATFLDYVNLRVGGRDHVIALSRRNFRRGVTFEAPRQSLVTALKYESFDDLLIGNFMKTILHGKWPQSRLYPHFSPHVGKYADNGRVRTSEELRAYLAEYRRRTGAFAFLRHRIATRAADMVRSALESDSTAYRLTRRAYWALRSEIGC